MSDFLATMAASSRERADATLKQADLPTWQARALQSAPPRKLELSDFDLIAEIKFTAPSAGKLQSPTGDVTARIQQRALTYSQAGAAAISVLTEPSRFDGSLAHLQAAAQVATAPVMRKDFLVDPVQVYEGRAHGASGVLIIVTMLSDTVLDALCDAAADCGMFVLAECFDTDDLARSQRLVDRWTGDQPLLVGVNTRNLRTLEVVADRLHRVAPHLPTGTRSVAESGMNTPEDVRSVASDGYTLALVGSALMRSSQPGALASAMIQAGREGIDARENLRSDPR